MGVGRRSDYILNSRRIACLIFGTKDTRGIPVNVSHPEENRPEDFFGIDPEGKSALEIETEWLENHYRGDLRQLSLRAVLMGMLLGGMMSLSNLYVGLKTGWSLGVAITACILSFSLGAALQRAGLLRSNLSILENNCMQSTASSAGYSTGGTLASAIAALLLIRESICLFGSFSAGSSGWPCSGYSWPFP